MTWEHIGVLAGVVALLVIAAELVSRWQIRRALAAFDAIYAWPADEPDVIVGELLPALPTPDPHGWSAQVGWSPWRAWLDCRHAAVYDTEPAIFTELALTYTSLAIEAPKRELEGATS